MIPARLAILVVGTCISLLLVVEGTETILTFGVEPFVLVFGVAEGITLEGFFGPSWREIRDPIAAASDELSGLGFERFEMITALIVCAVESGDGTDAVDDVDLAINSWKPLSAEELVTFVAGTNSILRGENKGDFAPPFETSVTTVASKLVGS